MICLKQFNEDMVELRIEFYFFLVIVQCELGEYRVMEFEYGFIVEFNLE